MTGSRKLYVKSFGCQMNVYDSQRMADTLAPEGYVETATAEDADLIILNTCHIREKAAEKVYSELGRVRVAEGSRGCRRPATCSSPSPAASPRPKARRSSAARQPSTSWSDRRTTIACRICLAARRRDGKVVDTEFPVDDKFDHLARRQSRDARARRQCVRHRAGRLRQILHLLRGALHARRGGFAPAEKIVGEVARLADAGVREITLIGQNVNAYHGDGPDGRSWTLARLLERLAELPGIDRLRYTTSHPRDMDDALIAAHRDLPALMPQLHLPVQSGSDRILAAMNRRHTRAGLPRGRRAAARGAARIWR